MPTPPPRLNLVVLRSKDIDRAARFYEQMGLRFTRHAHGSGPIHYSSEVNGLVFEIYPVTESSTPTISTRVGFAVDDVDLIVRLLGEIGAKIITPASDSQWGRRAVVEDFDGHRVELTKGAPSP